MSEAACPEIAVVHLVRACNDFGHYRRFIASYLCHPAGVEHQLVLALKGLRRPSDAERYLAALPDPDSALALPLPDEGFDIGAYVAVSKRLPHRFVMFINSFSEILAPNWLLYMSNALLTQPRAGFVGATGSWAVGQIGDAFPNTHLRTNGFLIDRETFAALATDREWTKDACYQFEYGPSGLSKTILARGDELYVVDRHGRAIPHAAWRGSRVYMDGTQENLMIADNQTRLYAESTHFMRLRLNASVWDNLSLECYQVHKVSRWKRFHRWLRGKPKRCRYHEVLRRWPKPPDREGGKPSPHVSSGWRSSQS